MRKSLWYIALPDKRFTSCAFVVFAFLLAPSSVPARADATITETMTFTAFNPIVTPVSWATSQFDQFDPTLGTLVSISASLNGTLSMVALNPLATPAADITLQDRGFTTDLATESTFGPTIALAFGPKTTPGLLGEYSGPGMVDLNLLFTTCSPLDPVIFTTDGGGTITYGYTPVAPTPEPGTVVLMLIGIGLMLVMRKRIAHRLTHST